MGEGFYDWYVAEVLRPPESASESSESSKSATGRMVQLLLPGIDLEAEITSSFYDDSF